MATLSNIYSDLDLTFNIQPSTGDISIVKDSRAVINSVKNILLMNKYDKLWKPYFGSNLRDLLFENVDSVFESFIDSEIRTTITNFEPRVTIQELRVTADPSNNGYNIFMSILIGNLPQPYTISTFLERIR